MKGFLRSKLVLALVMLVVLGAILAVPPASEAHAQPAPTITLIPTSGPPGTVVTVTGSGWNPGSTVDLRFSLSGTTIARATIASDGTFSTTITVPSNAALGSLNIVGDDAGVNATATFTVTPPPSGTVSFTKDATPTVTAGGTVDYVLTLTNTGNLQLHDIHLSDLLPGGLDAITVGPTITFNPPTGSGFGSCTKSGLSVSCTVDNFAPGAVATIKFSAKVDSKATGTITNTASAESFTLGKMTAKADTMVTPQPGGTSVVLCGLDALGILGIGPVLKIAGHSFEVTDILKHGLEGVLALKDLQSGKRVDAIIEILPLKGCVDLLLLAFPKETQEDFDILLRGTVEAAIDSLCQTLLLPPTGNIGIVQNLCKSSTSSS